MLLAELPERMPVRGQAPERDPMLTAFSAMSSKRCEWNDHANWSLTTRLAPEVAHVRPWWSWMGGASGAALGYIVANIPGAVAGGFAGNRLGAIRDAKGKSVAQVFSGLESSKKAEVRGTGRAWLTTDSQGARVQSTGKYGLVKRSRDSVRWYIPLDCCRYLEGIMYRQCDVHLSIYILLVGMSAPI